MKSSSLLLIQCTLILSFPTISFFPFFFYYSSSSLLINLEQSSNKCRPFPPFSPLSPLSPVLLVVNLFYLYFYRTGYIACGSLPFFPFFLFSLHFANTLGSDPGITRPAHIIPETGHESDQREYGTGTKRNQKNLEFCDSTCGCWC